MSLHVERSGRKAGSGRPPLVLLHGWGLGSDVWGPLLPALEPHFDLTRVDLPGLGRSKAYPEPYTLENVAAAILEQAPAQAVWLGWSLGGLVACEAARQAPQRVVALVTVASNPCFVARDGWSCAMPPETFDDFVRRLAVDPGRTLASFALLQTQGAEGGREALRLLKSLIGTLEPTALALALKLLAEDGRQTLASLPQPMLHIFGSEDRLVPAALVTELAGTVPQARIECYEGRDICRSCPMPTVLSTTSVALPEICHERSPARQAPYRRVVFPRGGQL
ncbi:alpha/beta fold hydrolase [Marinobacterium aestuariivivens]|uniref:Alpha/beta fold hydrolase n=1 Tax=Marinobacterium aestuariivivens TaxID=1698799 RepID=A0ABW1ZWS5_9GAMM